jgi:cell division protein FtsB
MAATRSTRVRTTYRPISHRGIRWDRLGRVALLGVLGLLLYLYIGPTRTWISTYRVAGEKREEVAALQERNRKLRARRASLQRAATLEREARRLGMIRAGEKAYVVQGLPGR